MQHIYSILGGSMKILTDNGTEFKNEVFREVLKKLGTVVLLPCGCLSLNPFIKINIRNNSSSSDVLNIPSGADPQLSG